MSYLGYTTKNIECYPLAASGPTVASPATAWAWGSWVEIVPANTITSDFVITHLIALEDPATPAVDTRIQTVFQLGIGDAGSEVVIISIPVTFLIDSKVGHVAPWIIPLPVPRKVAANSRVAIRVTDSVATAFTYGGCKIVYIKLNYT